MGGGCLTQSGQNNVCRLPLTDWPKDLWQEGVATHRDHAGLGQVGARVIVQIEELLQLLHSLQRKAPFSNLQATQRRHKGLQTPTQPPDICNPSSPLEAPLTLTCTAAEPPYTDSANRRRMPAALIFSRVKMLLRSEEGRVCACLVPALPLLRCCLSGGALGWFDWILFLTL